MSETRIIPLDLPPAARLVFGVLDPEDRDEDILVVRLPHGRGIDVGWYPSMEPDGEYRIVVFQNDNYHDRLIEPIRTRDPHHVAAEVSRIAYGLSKGSPAS